MCIYGAKYFKWSHCCIHRELASVLRDVVKIVNSIKSRASNCRLLRALCVDFASLHFVFQLHTKVSCFSCSKISTRLFELKYDVQAYHLDHPFHLRFYASDILWLQKFACRCSSRGEVHLAITIVHYSHPLHHRWRFWYSTYRKYSRIYQILYSLISHGIFSKKESASNSQRKCIVVSSLSSKQLIWFSCLFCVESLMSCDHVIALRRLLLMSSSPLSHLILLSPHEPFSLPHLGQSF